MSEDNKKKDLTIKSSEMKKEEGKVLTHEYPCSCKTKVTTCGDEECHVASKLVDKMRLLGTAPPTVGISTWEKNFSAKGLNEEEEKDAAFHQALGQLTTLMGKITSDMEEKKVQANLQSKESKDTNVLMAKVAQSIYPDSEEELDDDDVEEEEEEEVVGTGIEDDAVHYCTCDMDDDDEDDDSDY